MATAAWRRRRGRPILGTWRGTSTCVKSPEFPSCHDEVVVYEFQESAQGGDAVTCEAFKIVDGEKPVRWADLEFTYDAKQEAWVSEFHERRACTRSGPSSCAATSSTGTLVDLPSKHLIRNVAVRRERQKP